LALLTGWAVAGEGGWYLLVPPLSPYDEREPYLYGYTVLIQAPLSKLSHAASYDTAEACEAARAQGVPVLHREFARSLQRYVDALDAHESAFAMGVHRQMAERDHAAFDSALLSRCVASHDPRLRE
jgi:hypothetical protein